MSVRHTAFFTLVLSMLVARAATVCGRRRRRSSFISWRRRSATSIAPFRRDRSPVRASCRLIIKRARAYNGTCNQLVTEANVSQYLPDYTEYKTAVDATASLPSRRSAQDAAD